MPLFRSICGNSVPVFQFSQPLVAGRKITASVDVLGVTPAQIGAREAPQALPTLFRLMQNSRYILSRPKSKHLKHPYKAYMLV